MLKNADMAKQNVKNAQSLNAGPDLEAAYCFLRKLQKNSSIRFGSYENKEVALDQMCEK